ncbi:MAG: glycosyltransferase [Gemmatimonadaceae bacterium]|nr:glycosyltransferase [Gemmatimonadaceae bacterium]
MSESPVSHESIGTSARTPTDARTVAPQVAVIIAVYNRAESLRVLLAQLAAQHIQPGAFEVVVVDDGSTPPISEAVRTADLPFAMRLLRQDNAGPAAARDRGIRASSAPLVISLDDDMRVGPEFIAAHLAAHADAPTPRVVLGRLRPPSDASLRLFERYQLAQLDRLARRAATDPTAVRGGHVYSGNVSFSRALYDAVGGFDATLRLSEDAELGLRFERAGASIRFADDAWSEHWSDHTSLAGWMERSIAYGRVDSRVAEKHPQEAGANPWRFLDDVNPISRPLLRLAVAWPTMGRLVARLVLAVAQALAAIGGERLATTATTLAYGLLYYVGVRDAAGSFSAARAGRRAYLQMALPHTLRGTSLFAKCLADIRADQAMLRETDGRYRSSGASAARHASLPSDAVQRIGFQLMVAYRVMRLLRQLRLGLLAKVQSRLMRHVYGADIHWDAELAPGVVIVHGVGLVISHAARVGPGCILFQHVTLGESIHPVSRRVGGPTLEARVHVAPGAVLLGPIVIGHDSKIAANAVVTESIPAHSVVQSPRSELVVRRRDQQEDA